MFEVIKQNNLYPAHLSMDFEQAALNRCHKLFPDTEIHGCFFHFSQAVWRKIQNVRLQNVYNTDAVFAAQLRYLIALAFVPPCDVHRVFEIILPLDIFKINNDNRYKMEMKELLKYFKDTWLGYVRNGKITKQPLFPIKLWNIHEMAKTNFPRTNNAIESWHGKMHRYLGCSKPSVYKLIDGLKSLQTTEEINMVHIRNRLLDAKKRKKYTKYII